MKDRIIEESIQSLQEEGLRFSVDSLAVKLKISKKTIYKYFPTKEELAYAMFERYYADLRVQISMILQRHGKDMETDLLMCYYESAKMIRREIFNKYALNHVIGEFAEKQHLNIWQILRRYICGDMKDEDAEIYKMIIDGAFDKTIEEHVDAAAVIGTLRMIK